MKERGISCPLGSTIVFLDLQIRKVHGEVVYGYLQESCSHMGATQNDEIPSFDRLRAGSRSGRQLALTTRAKKENRPCGSPGLRTGKVSAKVKGRTAVAGIIAPTRGESEAGRLVDFYPLCFSANHDTP